MKYYRDSGLFTIYYRDGEPFTTFIMFGLTGIIILLVVLIGLFFLLREVNCWYWKINKRIELMEENNRLLNIIANAYTTGDIRVVPPLPSANNTPTYNPPTNPVNNFPSTPASNIIPTNHFTSTPVVNNSTPTPVNNVRSVPSVDSEGIPPHSFVNGKVTFSDGIQGEITKSSDNQFFFSLGVKRYYYNNEQNAIKAIYLLKTRGKISSNGLIL